MDNLTDTLYIPHGENLGDPLPGDAIFTHGNTWQSKLIQIGQSLRVDKQYCYWNHMAIITDDQGSLVEALNSGVCKTNLSNYQPKEYCVLRLQDATDFDRAQMVRWAEKQVGKRYGWITILSLGLSLLTGLKFNFGIDGQMICSGLVAQALFKGNDDFDRALDHMTPADMAKYYNIVGRGD